ncbi:MAG: hypothetical protein JNL82_14535 [Myxococcales bacterium]|nr:hypothetical protein [Myxococcales bacterium]
MKFVTILLTTLLCAGCDRAPDTTLRSGGEESVGSGDSTGTPEPPMPTPACRCDPAKKDECPLGTDCVPYGDIKDFSSYFCMAKCTGTNELGGGYVTSCTNSDGSPAFCKYAEGYGADGYCPKCVSCELRPNTLFCE